MHLFNVKRDCFCLQIVSTIDFYVSHSNCLRISGVPERLIRLVDATKGIKSMEAATEIQFIHWMESISLTSPIIAQVLKKKSKFANIFVFIKKGRRWAWAATRFHNFYIFLTRSKNMKTIFNCSKWKKKNESKKQKIITKQFRFPVKFP